MFCQTATLQNNSQCLLLNIIINATRDIFQFLRRNKITKNEHAGIKRKRNWRKSKTKRVSSFSIDIVVYLPFCYNWHQNLQEDVK